MKTLTDIDSLEIGDEKIAIAGMSNRHVLLHYIKNGKIQFEKTYLLDVFESMLKETKKLHGKKLKINRRYKK